MSDKFGYIYITTNKVNNMKYIGQHKSQRFEPKYKGSGIKLKFALKEFGSSSFVVNLIEWCSTQEELDVREQFWIKYYNASKREDFYNVSLGGSGGKSFYYGKFTDEHRKHLSQSLKGRVPWCKNLTVADPRVRKCANSFLGKHHTDRTKQILSYKHRKENLSTDTLERLSKSHKIWMGSRGTCFWINDGTHEYFVNDLEYKEKLKSQKDLVRGRLPDFIYMTKDNKSIKTHKSNIDDYLKQGYYLGRDTKTIENIRKSRQHNYWIYKDKVFCSAKELATYLNSNGYPDIVKSTVINIGNGKIIKKYKDLSGLIIRKPMEEINED